MTRYNMTDSIDSLLNNYQNILKNYQSTIEIKELGRITAITDTIVTISGLQKTISDELLIFEDGSEGIALNLNENTINAVLLSRSQNLEAGMSVIGTGKRMETVVGYELLGRVIDAKGKILDGKSKLSSLTNMPIEKVAPSIMSRQAISRPLQTGIKVIDSLIPIGLGQRQLILGDRQTGKTAIAIDTICNQKEVICIYCAIGQKASAVKSVINQLEETGAIKYTIVVVATADSPPGLQYITPFAATTIAEFFMLQGKDVLIIYDDLTRHAQAYREQSLLLERPPGREAYPGDIFYLHARLLERSTALKSGGSLTALPIIETQEQNISSYITTNLISITDGQIYLNPLLFQKGQFPAIDVGKSVSRVGGKAQLTIYKSVIKELSLAYAQFEELESFARFSTRLDQHTKQILNRGQRARELFKQNQTSPLLVSQQIIILIALNHGFLDDFKKAEISNIENYLLEQAAIKQAVICKLINTNGHINDSEFKKLVQFIYKTINNKKVSHAKS